MQQRTRLAFNITAGVIAASAVVAAIVSSSSSTTAPQPASAPSAELIPEPNSNKTLAEGYSISYADTFLETNFPECDIPELLDRALDECDNKQFLCFGESSHIDEFVVALTASSEFMKALAEHGIKKIAIEIDPQFQPIIDMLAEGQISRETFRAVYSHYLDRTRMEMTMSGFAPPMSIETMLIASDRIIHAVDNGIRVYAADHKDGTRHPEHDKYALPANKALWKGFALQVEQQIASIAFDDFLTLENLLVKTAREKEKGFTPEQLQKIVETHAWDANEGGPTSNHEFLKRRMLGEEETAERFKEIAGSERLAIVYGVAHFQRDINDIDAFLGDGAHRIDIMRDNYVSGIDYDLKLLNNGSKYEAPESRIDPKNMRLETQTAVFSACEP